MIRLSDKLKLKFNEKLIDFEMENETPYVTSIEEYFLDRATAHGIEQADLRSCRLLIEGVLGHLPSDIDESLTALSGDALSRLIPMTLKFESADEVRQWISQNNG